MKKKGFTLIEIIVTSAILLILLGSLYSFFNTNYMLLFEEKKKAYIESQVKSFMDFTMQSLQMSYQEKIEAEDAKLTLYLPAEDNSQVEFDASKSIKIDIYYNNGSIFISKIKNGIKSDKALLSGSVKNFKIEKILGDRGSLEGIEIKFIVNYDFKFRNLDKEYFIKYNIRK
ncbi:prepilin-type N-terminal cleavage/methylation domain-containing protein [Caloramator quimbayensis]|uniref:Prepilin-type N-terminal cleavage/methylation domain-containing protein n=1 Tax=Caloramator quimbayensis TaxID=1147123 RepID=A0A1T4WY00_9CLOT|nr:prepilin-type N-terminal cleavage/methylation domain-containing protein [Caloramator quimbayensis]SKA82196.1 prepilin-type N-terminal cleavage/methylation domain-containing protein [Caloramator quimbayensis]